MTVQTQNSLPRLNEPAPDFEAKTTHGPKKLEDYKGRWLVEFLRLLKAMQTSDQHKVATPEGWEPGQQVIVPPPATAAAAAERMVDSDCDCKDWYFCEKSLHQEQQALV